MLIMWFDLLRGWVRNEPIWKYFAPRQALRILFGIVYTAKIHLNYKIYKKDVWNLIRNNFQFSWAKYLNLLFNNIFWFPIPKSIVNVIDRLLFKPTVRM